MKVRLLLVCAMLLGVFTALAWAKRSGPAEVAPVVKDGVKYVALQDNGKEGKIEARDATTDKKLWDVVVYTVTIKPDLEEDVQWVFIKSLALSGNTLTVMNEKDTEYTIDVTTKKVQKVVENEKTK